MALESVPPGRASPIAGPWEPVGWLRELLRSPAGSIGLVLIVLVITAAALASVLAPFDPLAPVGRALAEPSATHPMGTDDLGRDVLSGVLFGARASMGIGLGVAAIVAVIGFVVGAISGYVGGNVDDVLMRITETVQVLPRFFLAIVVLAIFGPGLDKLVLVLGVTSWAIVARVVRAETLSLRRQEFLDAARAMGATQTRILQRHVLPNVLPSMRTYLALTVAQAILMEASLGFLGLSDPSVMTWGALAGTAQRFLRVAWWLAVFPGGAIAVAVLGINLLSDGFQATSASSPTAKEPS